MFHRGQPVVIVGRDVWTMRWMEKYINTGGIVENARSSYLRVRTYDNKVLDYYNSSIRLLSEEKKIESKIDFKIGDIVYFDRNGDELEYKVKKTYPGEFFQIFCSSTDSPAHDMWFHLNEITKIGKKPMLDTFKEWVE